ncbi:low affinity iron permease family protein [Phenylobacterium sp. VNQ135]|uniref:low affinity iron permease family protein n=1 Tax=Phenylobacterium sp. VNQ135 TaxID=3400922 RepID=UPI003C0A6891
MTGKAIQRGLTHLGVLTGHPAAFILFGAYVAAWFVFDRAELTFHSVATLITWLMTLFIQRAEHRDTEAVQAKLDELLRAHGEARSELTRLDEKTASEIEEHREAERRGDPPS